MCPCNQLKLPDLSGMHLNSTVSSSGQFAEANREMAPLFSSGLPDKFSSSSCGHCPRTRPVMAIVLSPHLLKSRQKRFGQFPQPKRNAAKASSLTLLKLRDRRSCQLGVTSFAMLCAPRQEEYRVRSNRAEYWGCCKWKRAVLSCWALVGGCLLLC